MGQNFLCLFLFLSIYFCCRTNAILTAKRTYVNGWNIPLKIRNFMRTKHLMSKKRKKKLYCRNNSRNAPSLLTFSYPEGHSNVTGEIYDISHLNKPFWQCHHYEGQMSKIFGIFGPLVKSLYSWISSTLEISLSLYIFIKRMNLHNTKISWKPRLFRAAMDDWACASLIVDHTPVVHSASCQLIKTDINVR